MSKQRLLGFGEILSDIFLRFLFGEFSDFVMYMYYIA